MRRMLVIAAGLLALSGFAVVSSGAGEGTSQGAEYFVELDNAFGLIEGADMKIAGVKAGKISSMKLDRRTKHALIGIEVEKGNYSSLRVDAFCESLPQSLIGEYFINCTPGRGRELKDGARIPIKQTASTVAPDLVNNVLRRPYRERLRIILNELGTGVAGRGEDLNEAVRRGVPALRETDNLLALLAKQNQTLKALTTNADRVITDLANNSDAVTDFVSEARDTSVASAARQAELAGTFRNLPGFLEELEPTMKALGRVADEQTPALRDLNAASGDLTRFFNNLGPFSDASRPAIRSLGEASEVGLEAVRAAGPDVAELRRFAAKAPEVGKNLAIILEHLDSQDNAVEKDADSRGGKGYTGLEALLQYVYDQSLSINIHDENFHILKINVLENHCAPYRNAESVRADPALYEDCRASLGPTQPGINAPDPTATASKRAELARQQDGQPQGLDKGNPVSTQGSSGNGQGAGGEDGATGANRNEPPINLQETINQLLNGQVPNAANLPNGQPAGGAGGRTTGEVSNDLLGYLLSP